MVNATIDLRSEFSWNTKQLFVHVDMEFATLKWVVQKGEMRCCL